jgi:ABC-type oligopeptide transport system substrate-binding subunit
MSNYGGKEIQMKSHIQVALLALAAFAPLAAQSPQGWKMRVDRSTAASDPDAPGDIKFVVNGSGFHATNPQAAVYWNPANSASGTYNLKGTFTLMKPSGHNNYYGLVFGGSGLEGPQQSYSYFVIGQNGSWLIKHREGDTASNVTPRTPSDAVKKPDDTGKSTNALEVRVGADKIDFVVNGVVVHSEPKTGALAKTDGIYGIRVNHLLEVQVDGLTVSK